MRKKSKRTIRIKALILCVVMIVGQMQFPTTVYAENNTQTIYADGLCEHHSAHTDECGYVEGHGCNHTHTDDCYTWVTNCVHTEHTEECYPIESTTTDAEGNTIVTRSTEIACPHKSTICTRRIRWWK